MSKNFDKPLVLNKAVTRNTFGGNGFDIVDFTPYIELIPRVNKLARSMGLFSTQMDVTDRVELERVQELSELLNARERGGEKNFVGSENAETRLVKVPYFPALRQITEQDLLNLRDYATFEEGTAPKTLQKEVVRIMKRLRRSFEQTQEKAMMEAVQGRSYIGASGSGTVIDYYTLWGLTQKTANVDFTDLITNPATTLEKEARKHIQANAQDNADSYEIVAFCGSGYFDAYVEHPLVENAFTYFESKQDPLRKRLGMGSENANNRVFHHKGITLIEDYSGNTPDLECYIYPKGIDGMFKTFHAPIGGAKAIGKPAQELLLEYKESEYFNEQKVELQTSFLCANMRPELVVKSVGTV